MQPLEAPTLGPDDGAPSDLLPRLTALDPASIAASRGRHPSSRVEAPAVRSCDQCGFAPPSSDQTAEALRDLAPTWRVVLQAAPQLIDRTARLRDELHAVSNRVTRLVAVPGSQLSTITINTPTALAAGVSPEVVLDRLQKAAHRLAEIVDTLHASDWRIEGHVTEGRVTVADLVWVPLHHSHRDLVVRDSPGAAVVSLAEHRRSGRPPRLQGRLLTRP